MKNEERRIKAPRERRFAFLILRSAFEPAARVGLAPTPCGLTNRRATLTPTGNLKLALSAGLPPASFRLEGGCLMYSTTAAIREWSERQDFHLGPPGPQPGALKTELRSDKMT